MPFKLASIFFYMNVSTIFLSLSWLSGTKRCSRFILLFLSLNFGNNHFFKESWFLLAEIVFRNQDLHARWAFASELVVFRTAQCTELRNTYPYIYFSLYIKIYEFTLIPDTSWHWFQHYWVNASLTSFPTCNSFHWLKKLCYHQYILLFAQPPCK